jgi:hypothetical protein
LVCAYVRQAVNLSAGPTDLDQFRFLAGSEAEVKPYIISGKPVSARAHTIILD